MDVDMEADNAPQSVKIDDIVKEVTEEQYTVDSIFSHKTYF